MRRRVAAVAVAALLLPGAAACSGSDHTVTTPVADTTSAAPERLTPESAAQTFREFVNNDDVARASGDERLALSLTSDGQSQLTAAEYRKSAFTGDPLARYAYGTPAIFTPRLTNYPQWFVVEAGRVPQGQTPPATPAPSATPSATPSAGRTTASPAAPASPSGTRTAQASPSSGRTPGTSRTTAKPAPPTTAVAAGPTVLLGFVRTSADARWKLSLTTQVAKGTRVPVVQVDADGYATPLATFDAALVIPPRNVPGIQATLASEGPQSVAARVMKDGPYSTGIYDATQRRSKEAGKQGQAYDSVINATAFPIFPLRTADGGGMVLYSLSRTTVTFLKKKGGRLPVPREAAHLLDSLVLQDQLTLTETLQYFAADPLRPADKNAVQPKADVLGQAGDVTGAVSQQQSG